MGLSFINMFIWNERVYEYDIIQIHNITSAFEQNRISSDSWCVVQIHIQAIILNSNCNPKE